MRDRISFQEISETDLPFLQSLYASTREYEMAMVPWSDQEKQAFLAEQFRYQHEYYLKHFTGACFQLVLLDGRPVGRLYTERRQDEIRLIDIALVPECRNQGIGGMLMREILDEGRERGLPVRIHVEQQNPALRLYRRLGFKRVGDVGIYYLMEWSPDRGDEDGQTEPSGLRSAPE